MLGLDRRMIRELDRLRDTHPLPLKVRLWQGDEVLMSAPSASTSEENDPPMVTLHLRSPAAARRLIRPSL
ncbi:MAG: hypothetical protein ACO3AD_20490, partial [Burkholderiaceae bacterium]